MIVSVLTGLFSGFAPAWSASRLDPVTALQIRDEVIGSTPTLMLHDAIREIIAMALASLGANKLRSALTMIGITIGVFLGDFGDDRDRRTPDTRSRAGSVFSVRISSSSPNIRPMSARAATRRRNFETGTTSPINKRCIITELMEGKRGRFA